MPMELDKEELEKLSARERLEKLKQIEGEKKKEIDEVEKLIKESEREARIEERLRDNVEIPKEEAVDIGSLFTKEEVEQIEQGLHPAREAEESTVKYMAGAADDAGEMYSSASSENRPPVKADDLLTPLTYNPTEGKKLASESVGSRMTLEQAKKYQKG